MNAFFPEKETRSTYLIPYRRLYKQGIRGIIFDIDNTLVPPDAPADRRCMALFRILHRMGFRTCVVSNNNQERVRAFAEKAGTSYVASALKPLRKGYEEAMELMGTVPENTLSVGDQIFTDIWGANRLGIHSILVKPMVRKEEPQIVLKRVAELPVLLCYHRKKLMNQLPGSGK